MLLFPLSRLFCHPTKQTTNPPTPLLAVNAGSPANPFGNPYVPATQQAANPFGATYAPQAAGYAQQATGAYAPQQTAYAPQQTGYGQQHTGYAPQQAAAANPFGGAPAFGAPAANPFGAAPIPNGASRSLHPASCIARRADVLAIDSTFAVASLDRGIIGRAPVRCIEPTDS